MLLLSNFQDYYDHMIGVTGVDSKVIFHRKKIKETEFKEKNMGFNLRSSYLLTDFAYYVLSICGKHYFIKTNKSKNFILKWSDFHLITKEDLADEKVFHDIRQFIFTDYYFRSRKTKEDQIEVLFSKLHGIPSNGLINIHKKLNIPIFAVISTGHSGSEGRLHEKSPKLADIKGISGLLDPKQLFNDISFFIANVLNNCNPDIIQVSNKDKILKGGFDLKTSFRGKT